MGAEGLEVFLAEEVAFFLEFAGFVFEGFEVEGALGEFVDDAGGGIEVFEGGVVIGLAEIVEEAVPGIGDGIVGAMEAGAEDADGGVGGVFSRADVVEVGIEGVHGRGIWNLKLKNENGG